METEAFSDLRSPDGDDIEDIIMGAFSPLDLINLLGGNREILDAKHPDIQQRYSDYEERMGGKDKVKDQYFDSLKKLFSDPLIDNPNVFEGFEPETIIRDVLDQRFNDLVEIVQKSDYTEENKFSDNFLNYAKVFYGNICYNMSEGLVNGMDDLRESTKVGMRTYMARLTTNQNLVPMIEGMYSGIVWNLFLGCH